MKKFILNENYRPKIEIKDIKELNFFGGNYKNFSHEDVLYIIRDKNFKKEIEDKVKSWIAKNKKMCFVCINGSPLIQTSSGFLGEIIIFGAKPSDTKQCDINVKILNFGQGAMTKYYTNVNLVYSKYKIYPEHTSLKINY